MGPYHPFWFHRTFKQHPARVAFYGHLLAIDFFGFGKRVVRGRPGGRGTNASRSSSRISHCLPTRYAFSLLRAIRERTDCRRTPRTGPCGQEEYFVGPGEREVWSPKPSPEPPGGCFSEGIAKGTSLTFTSNSPASLPPFATSPVCEAVRQDADHTVRYQLGVRARCGRLGANVSDHV